jgi:ATP-dependent helicase HrpB
VRTHRRSQLGAIILEEHTSNTPDPHAVRSAFIAEIVRVGINALPWSQATNALRARLHFMHMHQQGWPDVSEQALQDNMEQWLGPALDGLRKWDQLVRVNLSDALGELLNWEQRASLDRLAPTHLDVPSGSRIAVNYDDPAAPVLAVKLQEVFGWTATPTLLDGRVPITLHLLSPAQRPVQVTRDLAGFWRNSYFEVRKDLRGRYPRHPWPEDPLNATPTRRAKPRGT